MLSELKECVERLRQEPHARKPSATSGDRYPFKMKPYDPPKEIKELGRIQTEVQKIAKEQFIRSDLKFV